MKQMFEETSGLPEIKNTTPSVHGSDFTNTRQSCTKMDMNLKNPPFVW